MGLSKLIRKPEAIWEFPVEGGLVLARPEAPVLFLLNSTAALLWHLLEESTELPAVVSRFAELCSISEALAARDIEATIQDWPQTILRPDFPVSPSIPDSAPHPSETMAAFVVENYALNSKKFRLFFGDFELAAEFAPRLAPLRTSATAQEGTAEVIAEIRVFRDDGCVYAVSDGETLVCEPTINAARAALLPELVRLAHGGRQWLCIVHAAACAFDNHCLLLPASSHSGKTTLTVALMQEGFEFLSDDSAAIDREARFVAPMPFALMVREESWKILQLRYPGLMNTPVSSKRAQQTRPGRRNDSRVWSFLRAAGAACALLSRDAEIVRFLTPTSVSMGARPTAFVFPKFVPEGEPVFTRIDSFSRLLKKRSFAQFTVCCFAFCGCLRHFCMYRHGGYAAKAH